MPLPEDDHQLLEAREWGWGALADRWGDLPGWVDRLHEKMLLWLHGETVEFVEYGLTEQLPSGELAYAVEDATELWATVLTGRFALRIIVAKQEGQARNAQVSTWEMVKRDELSKLEVTAPPANRPGLGYSFVLAFDGISGDITVPKNETAERPTDGRLPLFLSLRENYFTGPGGVAPEEP